MRQIRTSGLMSGDGKRGGAHKRQYPRPSSTLPPVRAPCGTAKGRALIQTSRSPTFMSRSQGEALDINMGYGSRKRGLTDGLAAVARV